MPHKSRGQQQPRPAYPFGGKRHPPSPPPHAGGPTPDQVSAQLGPPQVSRLGKVMGFYQVPRKPVFAVVELGPTQFKVGDRCTGVQRSLSCMHLEGIPNHACGPGGRHRVKHAGTSLLPKLL